MKLFPDSIINQTTESIIAPYSKVRPVIYILIILFILVSLVATYFISIDISVTAPGIIKPKGERSVISSPIYGKLQIHHLEENGKVAQGDTLFVVFSENVQVPLEALEIRKAELTFLLNDLNQLTSDCRIQLKSPYYISQYASYQTKLAECRNREEQTLSNYQRNQQLYNEKVVPLAELEPVQAEYENALQATRVLVSQQRAQWQADKNGYEIELRDTETEIARIGVQLGESAVLAPVDGTIQKIQNVANGMIVQAGQTIVEISPDGDLVAECYVSTKDIGLLMEGQQCRIQVDAFNYNQWGFIAGKEESFYAKVNYFTPSR